MSDGRIERERDHWNHQIPSVESVLQRFEEGPNPNEQLMLDAVPSDGHILDFACGAGISSFWLAARGAKVTGIDLSDRSIERAEAVRAVLDLDVEFTVADIEQHPLPRDGYDGMIGRFALHHLDLATVVPAMVKAIRPGARAAFLETMAINPVLRISRDRLVGRYGIPRVGTLDEHPLTRADIALLRNEFGEAKAHTGEYIFTRILDQQLFHRRFPMVTGALRLSDRMLQRVPAMLDWSYHQVVIATRTREQDRPSGPS